MTTLAPLTLKNPLATAPPVSKINTEGIRIMNNEY